MPKTKAKVSTIDVSEITFDYPDAIECFAFSEQVPDPDWIFVDSDGGVHRWRKSGNGKWHLPTLKKKTGTEKVWIEAEENLCCCCGRDRNEGNEGYFSDVKVEWWEALTGEKVTPGHTEGDGVWRSPRRQPYGGNLITTDNEIAAAFKAGAKIRFPGIGGMALIQYINHLRESGEESRGDIEVGFVFESDPTSIGPKEFNGTVELVY